MLLSIIIPVYNSEQALDYCLESLIDDRLEGQYEIICVNDGSTDNSLQKLKEWQSKYPQTIRIIDKLNAGMSYARNDGMKMAQGKWLFFCDSDDYIAKNSMSSIMNFIADYPDDLYMVNYDMKHVTEVVPDDFTGVKGVKFYGTSKEFFLTQLFWTSWVFLFRREFVLQEGIEFANVRGCEDALFNYWCLLKKEFKVLTLDADVYRYVANPNSICHSFSSNKKCRTFVKDGIFVLNAYQNTVPFDNSPEVTERMKWVSAKMIPNILARLLHTDMTAKEYKAVRDELLAMQCIPCETGLSRSEKFREFLLLHPTLFYVTRRTLEFLGLIKIQK